MEIITTPDAPQPVGHYAQAIVHNGLIYVAGQLPNGSGRRLTTTEEQTEQALHNVEAILIAAGSGLDKLITVTIFVAEIELWEKVNEVYARLLGDHRPARSVVPVTSLHGGYLLEIQATAAL